MKKQNWNLTKSFFGLVAFMMCLAGIVTSCSDDTEKDIPVTVFEVEDISCLSEERTSDVTFKAGSNWRASSDLPFVTLEPNVGEAGDVTMKVNVKKNETVSERTATVSVVVGETTHSFKVIQSGTDAVVSDIADLELKYDAASDLFTDTLQFEANIKWEFKSDDKWYTVTKLNEGDPIAGQTKNYRYAFLADKEEMYAKGREALVKIVDVSADNAVKKEFKVKFTGFTPKMTFSVTEVKLIEQVDGEYKAEVDITANYMWSIAKKDRPDWISDISLKDSVLWNAVEKTVKCWIYLDQEKMKLAGEKGEIIIKDVLATENGTADAKLPVSYDQSATDYFYTYNQDIFDKSIKGTGGSLTMRVKTARDYASLAEAPFSAFVLKADGGIALKEEMKNVISLDSKVEKEGEYFIRTLKITLPQRDLVNEEFPDRIYAYNLFVVGKDTTTIDKLFHKNNDYKADQEIALENRPDSLHRSFIDSGRNILFKQAGLFMTTAQYGATASDEDGNLYAINDGVIDWHVTKAEMDDGGGTVKKKFIVKSKNFYEGTFVAKGEKANLETGDNVFVWDQTTLVTEDGIDLEMSSEKLFEPDGKLPILNQWGHQERKESFTITVKSANVKSDENWVAYVATSSETDNAGKSPRPDADNPIVRVHIYNDFRKK